MANYIDGFVLPIPKKHLNDYKEVAELVSKIWKEHGALDYSEFVSEDLKLEGTRSFSDIANAKNDEIIIFGWVVFDSRESRDLVNKLVAADPRMTDIVGPLTSSSPIIFDATRMAYGGFEKLV